MTNFDDLGRTSMPGTRSYSLKSRHVDQTFQIDVAMPAVPVAKDQKLPVVYVTDGNGTFAMAAQIARMLQSGPEPLPPMLVVGIGYRFDRARSYRAQYFETRTRDFTSVPDLEWLELSRDALARLGDDVGTVTGGAGAFLAFIDEELKPFLASRYAVDEGDQTLTGMSLGGFFALNTLFHAAGSFSRYAALSPSLWWGNGELFRTEASLAARSNDLPVKLFLGVGGEEDADGAPYLAVSNLETMHATLMSRCYPGLRLEHQVIAGETHISVYPAAFCRALRSLFDLSSVSSTAPAASARPSS